MKRELIKIGANTYIVENSPSAYLDYYVLEKNIWQHLLPGWGSSGHGDTKKIIASTRHDLGNTPVIKASFISSLDGYSPGELEKALKTDHLFMFVKVKEETLDEACSRCFEEMKKSNPKGGPKEFVRLAVLFGVNWSQEHLKK